jgi:Cellulase M and related proteins
MERSGSLKEIETLLEKFTNAHGISGSEDNIRNLLEMEIEPYIDTIQKDVMGNLIATKKEKGLL